MRFLWILPILGLGACSSAPRDPTATVAEPAAPRVVQTSSLLVPRATRYSIGHYRYPKDGARMLNSIVRVTYVPPQLAGKPVIAGLIHDLPSLALAPLPPSAELNAELSTQRQITARLRTIEQMMATLEEQARGHYGALLSERNASARFREQLEAESQRLRRLNLQLQERVTAATAAANPLTPPVQTSTSTEGIEW